MVVAQKSRHYTSRTLGYTPRPCSSRDSVDNQYTTKWVPVELPSLMMDKLLVWKHADSDDEVCE